MKHVEIDRIYRNIPLDEIPWNIETPPDALVALVESGEVEPCRTIDLGWGTGKYRETRLGTILYFSSEDELKDLFEPCFHIIDLRTIEISGKFGPHIANYAFMEKSQKIGKYLM